MNIHTATTIMMSMPTRIMAMTNTIMGMGMGMNTGV
jgi:hypothetical protein